MGIDGPTGSATTDSDSELIDELVQATFMTMAVLNGIAAEHDLSLTQLRVLAILRDRQVGVGALAGHLGLDKSTVSGLVDRAEKRGLLVRKPNEHDGRAVDVTVSMAGSQLADNLYTRVAQGLSPAIERLSRPERDRLRVLLGRLLG